MYSTSLKSYKDVGTYGRLNDANPHEVVAVMLDTLLTRVAEARGCIERGDTQGKGTAIGKAMALVEGLVLSLDPERGGTVAENLQRLYDYMSRTLLRANLENRAELLVEVGDLTGQIKSAWEEIGQVQ
jgi:flagellar protein FliS